MNPERHLKLFRNGRNQALRIPREMELPGSDAVIRKEGNRLIVEPLAKPSLLTVLASLEPLDEDMPVIEELPVDDVAR
ncbi:MAG: AbrB/MazE/SpoVT family DNA-binding domain-containing protein [Gammaproteobacteria bacterium]|nr:AbrB/MazE/SpoVT family DNA-binding domain-containing protein [Gammaproteobacteria bacterium]